MVELRSQFKMGLAADVADITSGNLQTFVVNPSSFNTKITRTNVGGELPSYEGGYGQRINYGMNGREVGFLITFSGTNAETDFDTFKELAFHPDMKKLYIFGTSTSDSRYLIGQVYDIQENRTTSAPVKTIDVQVAFIAYDPCYYNDTEYTETITLTSAQTTVTQSVSLSGKMGNADSYFQIEVQPQGTAEVSKWSIADVDLSGVSAALRRDTYAGDGYNQTVDGKRACGVGFDGINPVADSTDSFYAGSIDLILDTNVRQFAIYTASPQETAYDSGYLRLQAGRTGTTLPYNKAGFSSNEWNINESGSWLPKFRIENEAGSQTISLKADGTIGASPNDVDVILTWKKRYW
ncbi:MAG: hypothetical protein VW262_05915 [Flavobacteriaceae bacterium]